MVFKNFEKNHLCLGTYMEDSDCFILFGNRHLSETAVEELFPNKNISFVRQKHTDQVVEAPQQVIADGQWTTDPKTALGIYTADCLPVLFSSPDGSIASAHAGWRGVQNMISGKTFERIAPPFRSQTRIFIGPHISKNSFEIEIDLAEKIAATVKNREDLFHPSKGQPQKTYLDLSEIVRRQLIERGALRENIFTVEKDTFLDPHFYSYRREKKTGLRNFSLIARKPL